MFEREDEGRNDLNIMHVGNYQENKEFEELNSVKIQSGTEKKK